MNEDGHLNILVTPIQNAGVAKPLNKESFNGKKVIVWDESNIGGQGGPEWEVIAVTIAGAGIIVIHSMLNELGKDLYKALKKKILAIFKKIQNRSIDSDLQIVLKSPDFTLSFTVFKVDNSSELDSLIRKAKRKYWLLMPILLLDKAMRRQREVNYSYSSSKKRWQRQDQTISYYGRR